MAHSGPLLACAATLLGPIGVDIERPRPGRDLTGIADAAFGPAEIRRSACGGPAAFYRIWTLREAIAKAMGEGLALVADRSDRAAEGPDEGSWRWQDWCLAHYRQPGDVCLALALRPHDATVGEIDWHDITVRGT